jgi:hypothetical protein
MRELPEPAAWAHEYTDPHTDDRRVEPRQHKPRDYELLPGDVVTPLFTASQLRQAVQEAVEAERRRCAELCEGLRDLREEARAILKASAALSEGDAAETLRRLRHESDVRLHNGALDRAAAAIRSGA